MYFINKLGCPPLGVLLLFSVVLLGGTAAAQQVLTMDEAVEMALSNHPSLQAADRQIEQGKALQHLKYTPGTTDIDFQGDGLFRENGQRVNQLGASQNFPSPAGVKAQNALQDERVVHYELEKELTKNELRLKVQQLYLELQQQKKLLPLYQSWIQRYEQFLSIANTRVELGVTNRIESLRLSASLDEYKLLERQVKLAINNLEKQLQHLLQAKEAITSSTDFELMDYASTDSKEATPTLLARQAIALEQAEIKGIQAELKPSFQVGYALQNYFDGGWLSGVQAGVQLPLFKKQNKQRVEAQKLQAEVAKNQVKSKQFELEQKQLSAANTIAIYAEGAAYYKERIERLNQEMERISQLNYQAGEISYLELLNIINVLESNHLRYWEQVGKHNQAVVYYLFLFE